MRHTILSLSAAAVCFAVVILSVAFSVPEEPEKPGMEIIIGRRAVVFSGISERAAKELAETNGFDDPLRWPVLGHTGHPFYTLPPDIHKREKTHPEWELKRLLEYRVAFEDLRGERVVLLYRQEARVLILLYYKLPKMEVQETEQ